MLVISAFPLPLSLKKKPEGSFPSAGLIKNVANQNLTGKGQFYIGFKGQCPNLLLLLNLLLQVWSLNRYEEQQGNKKVSHLMHSVALADLIMPTPEAVQGIIQYVDWCKVGRGENEPQSSTWLEGCFCL